MNRPSKVAGVRQDPSAPYDSIFKLTLIILDSFEIQLNRDAVKFIKDNCTGTGITRLRNADVWPAALKEFGGGCKG